jgi:glycosyltransferase involved in cell wall biosynthesis
MKVLAVAFCPSFGAIPDIFIGIVNELSTRENIDLFVLCPENLNVDSIAASKTYKIKYDKSRPYLLLSRASLKTINQILEENFDVVFFFSQHILNLPFSVMMRHVNQVMWWHEPLKKGRTTLLKYLLYIPHDYQLTRQARKIIVACEAMKELVPNHLKHKLEFIPLPASFLTVNLADDAGNNLVDDAGNNLVDPIIDFVFFGKIDKYKGLDILAKAMRCLCEQKYSPKLKIIGMGDLNSCCPLLADFSKTNPQNIEIINSFASEMEIIDSLKTSRAVVLPYLTATGTTTVQIASQQHRPVIATRVGCFQNYVIDGETGWLVPADDFLSLAEALKEVIDNPEKTKLMGEAAHRNFMANYTQEIIGDKLLIAFEK